MILHRLKTSTRDLHDQLEAAAWGNELRQCTLSLHQYQALLSWQYLVHCQLEPLLHSRWMEPDATGYAYQSRLPALRRDLQALDTDVPVCSPAARAVRPDEAASAGLLYVLEGASLGGSMISRLLPRCAELAGREDIFSFYHYQRDHGLPAWKAFSARIKQMDWSDENQAEAAVAEARATFLHFHRLLSRVESH